MNTKKETATAYIAYHEAGHAVADYLLPYAPKTKKATIVREGNTLGHVISFPLPSFDPENNSDLRTVATMEHFIIGLLSGMEAEKHYTGNDNYKGARSDYDQEMDLLSRLDGDPDCAEAHFKYLQECTRCLVKNNWKLIEALAAALLEHKTLSGRKVKEILDTKRFGAEQVATDQKGAKEMRAREKAYQEKLSAWAATTRAGKKAKRVEDPKLRAAWKRAARAEVKALRIAAEVTGKPQSPLK